MTRFVALAALALVGCGGPPPPHVASGPPEPSQCIGGLCVRPDHAVTRHVRTLDGRRCLILAWDGDNDLPPTAKVGFTDASPAHPGVFLAVEVPSWRAGVKYGIANDPMKARPSETSAIAVRVDPAVRFADQRIADQGEVVVIPSGDDLLVLVKTTWSGHDETAQFVVPKAHNGCGAPVEL